MNRQSMPLVWQAVGLVLLFRASFAAADVLPDHDNGPLTGVFGFPESTEGGELVSRGRHDWDASLIIASHNIDETSAAESLRLDGETTRLALSYHYGIADKLDLSIQVPLVWHRSGFLDSAIDGWHDFFSLPDGPRDQRAQDQLEFFYSDTDVTVLNTTRNANGVGDVRLLLGWRLPGSENRSTALRFGMKLPTGDSDELLGSGGADLSIGLASDVSALWGQTNLSGFYRANVSYLGEPDFLANRYKDVVGQFSFGIAYRLHRRVDVSVQSRIRSAVYASAIENLGKTSTSLTFGAGIKMSDSYRLVLSVGEDVNPDSAPDVSFQIALRYRGHD